MANSILDFPEDNVCCIGRCHLPVVPEIHAPFCLPHARKAFARMNAYFGAKTIVRSVLENRPRGPMKATNQPGLVYIVRHGTRVKIGFTTNLEKRMKSVPHDEVLATIPGSMASEAALHEKFADIRLHGEWFEATQDLLDFAAQLAPAAA